LSDRTDPRFHAWEYTKNGDDFPAVIMEMIKKRVIGTRIDEELSAVGFTGSLSTVERIFRP